MNTPQPAPAQPLGRASSCPQAWGMVRCIWDALAGCVTSAESLNFSETPSLFLAEPRKAPQWPPAHRRPKEERRKKAGPTVASLRCQALSLRPGLPPCPQYQLSPEPTGARAPCGCSLSPHCVPPSWAESRPSGSSQLSDGSGVVSLKDPHGGCKVSPLLCPHVPEDPLTGLHGRQEQGPLLAPGSHWPG